MIVELSKQQIAGIDVQAIVNHGQRAWRIFKPGCNGDYFCQFLPSAAAVSIMRWTREPASIADVLLQLQKMHEDQHEHSK